MAQRRDLVEIQFIVNDGTVISLGSFRARTTIKQLKKHLMVNWPRERLVYPENVEGIELICNEQLLEDRRTLVKSGLFSDDLQRGVITILVVIADVNPDNLQTKVLKGCSCTIL